MPESRRETLRWFPDINGTEVYEGDRVAVAEGTGAGLRIGEVVEDGITGVFADNRWQDIRVRVRIDTTSSYWATGNPYTRSYDRPKRMVKLSVD
jgi:hypothetical protein